MLKRFYVDNFKTLINVEWKPGAVNLLVGPNNAGKTNLCTALRFLSLTSGRDLKESAAQVGEVWQLHNVYLSKPTIDFECAVELDINGVTHFFDYSLSLEVKRTEPFVSNYAVKAENLSVTPLDKEKVELIRNEGGEVRLLHETRYFKGKAGDDFVATHAPDDATMLSRLFDLETNRLSNVFKKYLYSWTYFSLNPQAIRMGSAAKPADWILNVDGSNLASVLYALKNLSEPEYRMIIDLMKEFEPNLDSISFHSPQQDQVFMLFSHGKQRQFSPMAMSEGTLRFLAMAYIIIRSKASMEWVSFSPLVTIEEPENSLFVGHLRKLFDLLDYTGASGQYLFTTQSPYVIDLFDKALEDIRVAVRRDNHTELRAPEREHLKELLDEMSLGEIHFRGLLY